MKEMFQAISNCAPCSTKIVMTALDGEWLGEKTLICDGKMIWNSREDGFFAEHQTEVCSLMECGIVTVDGCRIFSDVLGQPKQLVVCGGGNVALPVIQIGKMMGWDITVLEDRPKFADLARKAGAEKVICESFEKGLSEVPEGPDTYYVIVTRGHRYDQICLESIVKKEHAYIGMIGSRCRVAIVKQQLMESGSDPKVLEAVHTPIGLDIGAETPEEIGVAIMAEIIEVKNRKQRTFGYAKEMSWAVMDQEKYPDKKVMVTIVDRKGSAPRGVGVKMLILADGTCIGTIGGGCMEAEIFQKAMCMLRVGDEHACIYRADLSGAEAEEEGMVCGGIIDVLLEVIEGKQE